MELGLGFGPWWGGRRSSSTSGWKGFCEAVVWDVWAGRTDGLPVTGPAGWSQGDAILVGEIFEWQIGPLSVNTKDWERWIQMWKTSCFGGIWISRERKGAITFEKGSPFEHTESTCNT